MNAAVAEAVFPGTRKFSWRRFGGKFLVVSIAAHVLFAAGAAVWVVQTIHAQRKLTFTSAPPSPNPATRALEHQVQLAKRKNTMSAPAMAKRITTTAISKVSLPDMPAMPKLSALAPTRMAGMGGTGMGMGFGGFGAGSGFGGGGGGIFTSSIGGLKIKAQTGIFQSESTMIAVSSDDGANWKFIDASGKDQGELEKLLPGIADKLNLPPDKPPVKISNGD